MSLLERLEVPAARAGCSKTSTRRTRASAACATPAPWIPPPTMTRSLRSVKTAAALQMRVLEHLADGHGLDQGRAPRRELLGEARLGDFVVFFFFWVVF